MSICDRAGCQGDEQHAAGGQGDKGDDAQAIGDVVDVIRSGELYEKGRDDIEEEDSRLGYMRTDEIESSREDDDIENIVDEACK